jgi:putative membrane protein
MMYWDGGGVSWWGVTLMWVGMLVFWGLVIWLVYMLAVSGPRRSDDARSSSALRILDERYARGEIDTDEYRSRREALTTGASSDVGLARIAPRNVAG